MSKLNHLILVGLTAASLFSPRPVLAQATELIFNAYLPPQNAMRKAGIEDFARRIEQESGGSLKIVIPDATLAPTNQQYSMLLDGVADMAFMAVGDMSQTVTLPGIGDIPYNAPSGRAGSIALWETYKKFFEPMDEYKGVVVLSMHTLNGRQIMSVNKPVDSAAALSGIKIWVPPGPMTELVAGTGAVPTYIAFPELADGVSKGLVDALITTPGSAVSGGVVKKLKHYTKVPGGLGSVSIAVMISKERWEGLTDDQRVAILRAADGLPGRVGQAVDDQDKGVDLSHITAIDAPADLTAALKPHMDRQVDAWKERAKAKGLANPDEALEFYHGVLKREAGKSSNH